MNDKKSNPNNPNLSIQKELDEIYSLLSYSIVYKYWQEDDRNGRGYNVGIVLVNKENNLVDWDINFVNSTGNSTQHGEVRLISRYLNKEGIYSLEGYTAYPTLEPCAMCAGMMTMTLVQRTVNGQTDYYFSKALERLAINSEAYGGYVPYPRLVISQLTPSPVAKRLDDAYHEYINCGNKPIITKFLSSNTAKEIYKSAFNTFLTYQCKNQQNIKKLEYAHQFYNSLPDSI